MGIFLNFWIGKKIKIPKKLKEKWAKAKLIAISDFPIETKTAVTVVPIFTPIINGKYFSKETFLETTKGTVTLDITELERASAVSKKPANKDW